MAALRRSPHSTFPLHLPDEGGDSCSNKPLHEGSSEAVQSTPSNDAAAIVPAEQLQQPSPMTSLFSRVPFLQLGPSSLPFLSRAPFMRQRRRGQPPAVTTSLAPILPQPIPQAGAPRLGPHSLVVKAELAEPPLASPPPRVEDEPSSTLHRVSSDAPSRAIIGIVSR